MAWWMSRSRLRRVPGCVLHVVGLDGFGLCDPCALVRPRVPCVSCVSRLPPVSFNGYTGRPVLVCMSLTSVSE